MKFVAHRIASLEANFAVAVPMSAFGQLLIGGGQ